MEFLCMSFEGNRKCTANLLELDLNLQRRTQASQQLKKIDRWSCKSNTEKYAKSEKIIGKPKHYKGEETDHMTLNSQRRYLISGWWFSYSLL